MLCGAERARVSELDLGEIIDLRTTRCMEMNKLSILPAIGLFKPFFMMTCILNLLSDCPSVLCHVKW